MKRILLLFVVSFIALSSCKKKKVLEGVNFHGHIFNCDSTPVPNVQVKISALYYSTSPASYTIGYATTDANGNYSLTEDVDISTSIRSYYLVSSGVAPYGFSGSHSYTSAKDIEINAQIHPQQPITVHVKNTNPYNSSDLFQFVSFDVNGSGSPDIAYATQLYGTSVDTSFNTTVFPLSHIIYEYKYVKNNSVTTVYDTVQATPPCYPSINIDVFY